MLAVCVGCDGADGTRALGLLPPRLRGLLASHVYLGKN